MRSALREILAYVAWSIGALIACGLLASLGLYLTVGRSQKQADPVANLPAAADPVTIRFIPWVGEVEVQNVPVLGTVIVDRSTHGDHFFLADLEAESCLDFLEIDPFPSEEAIEAVCPGRKAH